MKLKPIISSLSEVVEELRGLYVPGPNGNFVLELEGAPVGYVEKRNNDEMRDSNIALKRQLEELQKQVLSPEQLKEFNALQEQQRQLKDKELIDAGKFEELFDSRTLQMRKEYDTRYNALNEAHEALKKQYGATNDQLAYLSTDSAVSEALNTVGAVRPGARLDLMNRARSTWKWTDGKLRPYDSEGNLLYGKSGKEELSMVEWAAQQAETAPYLFEPSQGSGSKGSGQGNSGQSGNTRSVNGTDNRAFIDNIEGIAKGSVNVFTPAS